MRTNRTKANRGTWLLVLTLGLGIVLGALALIKMGARRAVNATSAQTDESTGRLQTIDDQFAEVARNIQASSFSPAFNSS